MKEVIFFGCIVGICSSAVQSLGLTLQRKSHILELNLQDIDNNSNKNTNSNINVGRNGDSNNINNENNENKNIYKNTHKNKYYGTLRGNPIHGNNRPSLNNTINTNLDPNSNSKSYCKPARIKNMWRIGLILFLLANIFGSSIQISTLPIIILSPLQSIGLVFNSIFASLMLNEPFIKISVIGTFLVFLGALLIANFGVIVEPNYNLDKLLHLLFRNSFMIWVLISFLLVFLSLLLVFLLDFNTNNDRSINNNSNKTLVKGILYGISSAILSAHSLLMAKCSIELIIHHHKEFKRLDAYLIVSCFIILAISQLYLLNKGLRLTSTSVLYPLVFCVYNLTTIVNSIIYYNQLSLLRTGQLLAIMIGTILLLSGVVLLSWRFTLNLNPDSNGSSNISSNINVYSNINANSDSDTDLHKSIHSNINLNENTPLLKKPSKLSRPDRIVSNPEIPKTFENTNHHRRNISLSLSESKDLWTDIYDDYEM